MCMWKCMSLSLLQVYQMKRNDAESKLKFAGFLVISCPLKQDSKRNIQCLLDSSHYVSCHSNYKTPPTQYSMQICG